MDLSFIIVNYKSDQYLRECLASLRKIFFSVNYEISLVHNATEEETAGEQVPQGRDLHIHYAGGNLGFAKASNLGASFCQGNFLCFLNPDTVMLSSDGLHDLLHLLRSGKADLVGPGLVTDYSLKMQPWSAGKDVTLWETVKNNLGINASQLLWKSNLPIEAGWVSGACLFIRRDLFLDLEGFDENFFMYFEDVDLCRRARLKNKAVFFFPRFKVLHWGGVSSQSGSEQKSFYYRSQDYYFRKHFGSIAAMALKILRALFQKKA